MKLSRFVLAAVAAAATLGLLTAPRAAEDGGAGTEKIKVAEVTKVDAAKEADEGKVKTDSHTVRGKLDEVTVYRGQALVTRLIDVPGGAGLHEVVITDLPERISPTSLYAESAEGVEVRSVIYRIRPVEQDVREEVRKLDDEIRATQDQILTNQKQTQVLSERNAYLNKLEQFAAPTANVELTKGVLNAETLKALTKFAFDERQQVADAQLKAQLDLRDLNDKLNTLQRQRQNLTAGSAKAIREAVVFLNAKQANGKLRLRYLVDGANWSPSYNARTDAKRTGVTMEYNASIQQMSGEDWTDVAMTLSTATPSLAAKAPVLDQLTIQLGPGAQPAPTTASAYFSRKKELLEQRKQVELNRGLNPGNFDNNGSNSFGGGAGGFNGQPGAMATTGGGAGNSAPIDPAQAQLAAQQPAQEDLDVTLNEIARESQVLDLVNTARVEKVGKVSHEDNEGVSVSYQLPGRSSLPSRADQQLIQIATLPMKAEFYNLAIPVLTSSVYEQASVVNSSKMVLLAGPVQTYVAGQFVGHGDVPTVSIGESFTVGLGIDSSLRAHRELAKKNESIQGGNRVVDFTYQLELENFGSEAAEVRLMDRMPTAKETEVKLTLVSQTPALSEDTRYQQQDRKKGMLRWDVKVPPQSIGAKAFTLDYQMQMEYDKQLAIAGLPSALGIPAPAAKK